MSEQVTSRPPVSDEAADSELLRETTRSWWLVLLVGALSVVAGVIVLAKPSDSLTTLAVVCGIFIVVDSALELGAGLFARNGGAAMLLSVLGVVIGILLIRHPINGILAATLLVGLWFVAIGVIRLIGAVAVERNLWRVLVAVLEIVAGIVLVASPHIGFATLALLIGISFILNGAAMLGLGVVMRGVRHALPVTPRSRPTGA